MFDLFRRPSIRIVALTIAAFALAGCQRIEQHEVLSVAPEAELEAARAIAGVLPVEEVAAGDATARSASAVTVAAPSTR